MRFVRLIQKRRISETKIRLAIAQNPHSEHPEELWKTLDNLEESKPRSPEFDAAGFELLKTRLSQSPRFIVKS